MTPLHANDPALEPRLGSKPVHVFLEGIDLVLNSLTWAIRRVRSVT